LQQIDKKARVQTQILQDSHSKPKFQSEFLNRTQFISSEYCLLLPMARKMYTQETWISRGDSYCHSSTWTFSSSSYPCSHHASNISELFQTASPWVLFLCLKSWEIRQDIPIKQVEKFNILQRQKYVKMKSFV